MGTSEKSAGLLQVRFLATFRQKSYLTEYQWFINLLRITKRLFIFFKKYFRLHYTSLHF